MIQTTLFKKLVGEVLRGSGFSKKGSAWYRLGEDLIQVVDLQKSNYANKYFLNIGFYILKLGDEQYPKENHCHIRCRLDRLVSCDADRIFDLDTSSLQEGDQEVQIRECVQDQLLPELNDLRSSKAIKIAYARGVFQRCAVEMAVVELLNGELA